MNLRKHARLKNYDYRSNGYYFVTICSANRQPFLKKYKEELESTLKEIESRFNGVKINYYKLMEDHFHIIFVLDSSSVSLSRIVGTFKSLTTLEAKNRGFSGKKLWQPNYYEHIIRNEASLQKIQEYIENNPLAEKLKWEELDCK